MTDDQRHAALIEEISLYAEILGWRRARQFMAGYDKPDPMEAAVKARLNAARRMLEAIRRADRIDPDMPF